MTLGTAEPASVREAIRSGVIIPAHPLARTADLALDQRASPAPLVGRGRRRTIAEFLLHLPPPPPVPLFSDRFFLSVRRRSLAALVGFVARRFFGTCSACFMSVASRISAA